jgi:hypothetical protein
MPTDQRRGDVGGGLALAALRRARSTKQEVVALRLAIGQAGVSRLERQADLHVSTLRRYVAALGGRLELRAVFDDGATPIRQLAEVDAGADEVTDRTS